MSGEVDDGYVYLPLDDVREIYAAIFSLTTEQAADHLRSQEALEGALGRPASYAHYEQADLALQAAVLAHGIAETQSFVDGNKRTAIWALGQLREINQASGPAAQSEVQLTRGSSLTKVRECLMRRWSRFGASTVS